MSSRAQQKAAARQIRLAAESAERRRASRRRALRRLGVIASLALVVVVAAAAAGPGAGDPAPRAPHRALFDGIAQDGITLGSPKAPVVRRGDGPARPVEPAALTAAAFSEALDDALADR